MIEFPKIAVEYFESNENITSYENVEFKDLVFEVPENCSIEIVDGKLIGKEGMGGSEVDIIVTTKELEDPELNINLPIHVKVLSNIHFEIVALAYRFNAIDMEISLDDMTTSNEEIINNYLTDIYINDIQVVKRKKPNNNKVFNIEPNIFYNVRIEVYDQNEELIKMQEFNNLYIYNAKGKENVNILSNEDYDLEHLLIVNGNELTEISLDNFSNIKYLYISEAAKLTDINFLINQNKLKSLVISTCSSLKDVTALSNLTNLEYLRIEFCESITDLSVINNLKELNYLTIYDCGAVKKLMKLRTYLLRK